MPAAAVIVSTEPRAFASFEYSKIQYYFAFVVFKLLISLNAFILFVEEGENVDTYIYNI